MEKSKVPLKFGIQVFVLGTAAALLQGCATPAPQLASGGLQFTSGISEDAALTKTMSKFCDSAYIAVNQSQEITSDDVLFRYEKIRAMRARWASPYAIAELTKASLVSNKKPEVVYERFVELEKKLGDRYDSATVAELAKVSIIAEREASDAARALKAFEGSRQWTSKNSPLELAKVTLFSDRPVEGVLATYDEFRTRQGRIGGEKELIELTKSAILTGRTPNDIVKLFDQIERMDRGWVNRAGTAELVKLAILTNSSPKTVYFRYTDIASKQGRQPASVKKEHDRSVELTKLSLLGKRTSDDVVKLYDRFLGLGTSSHRDQAKLVTLSLISGELLQDSVWGSHVDECNGGNARLLLSIDSYRAEAG